MMTQEKLTDAITELDADILDQYFLMKQALKEKKKQKKHTWIKLTALAACFAFVVAIGMNCKSINHTNSLFATDVVTYDGLFIWMPVVLVSFISLCFSFLMRSSKTKTIFLANAIALVAVNVASIFGVYLYQQLDAVYIACYLPMFLISSNIGAIFFMLLYTLLGRKIKNQWIKLLYWVLVSVASIILTCMMYNIIWELWLSNNSVLF